MWPRSSIHLSLSDWGRGVGSFLPLLSLLLVALLLSSFVDGLPFDDPFPMGAPLFLMLCVESWLLLASVASVAS